MKKHSLYIIIFLFYAVQLYSFQSMDGSLIEDDDIINFTMEPSFGYLYGQSREIVYKDSVNDTYMSELIWDLTNIFYAGGTASINIINRFYLNGGIWFALNPGQGYMNDFDWIEGYDVQDGHGRTDWTHWSLSSVEIIDSLFIDINTSFDIFSDDIVKFSIIGGYKHIYWDWTDKILESDYPDSWVELPEGIDAIDYQLQLNLGYIGLGFGVFTRGGFIFDSRLIYSPLVFGADHDHHILRTDYGDGGIHFYDIIAFGNYLELSIKTGFSFSKWFTLTAQVSGEYLFEKRGDTYVYDNSGNYKGEIAGGAGIQYQAVSVSLHAAFSF